MVNSHTFIHSDDKLIPTQNIGTNPRPDTFTKWYIPIHKVTSHKPKTKRKKN